MDVFCIFVTMISTNADTRIMVDNRMYELKKKNVNILCCCGCEYIMVELFDMLILIVDV